MTRQFAYTIILIFAAVSIVISTVKPNWVSDQNVFLSNFVTHEFLNLLGVILAITLASTAQIHLAFNRIEERYKVSDGLPKSRADLRKATYWLIGLFVAAVVLVVLKPVACGGETAQAFFNMGALLILVWQILILISLTQLVYAIPPHIGNGERNSSD